MKTKNHFIIPYVGNKREEYEHIKPLLQLQDDKLKNIIEPFAGSCAISFMIWKEHRDKFNYYINDIDINLYNIYNLIKMESIEIIEQNINRIKNECLKREDYEFRFKNQRDIYDYIYFHRYFFIRYGAYNERRCGHKKPFKITRECSEFFDFIKSPNVFLSNDDGIKIFEYYCGKKNNVLILDPPYLGQDNNLYNVKNVAIYEYLNKIKLKDIKANIYVWVNDNWITRLIFQKWYFLKSYPKKYNFSRRNVEHTIICNKMLS